MQIIIKREEARELVESIKATDARIEEIKEELKDNKVLKYVVDYTSGDVTVDIDANYMTEFLQVYGKYMKIAIPQIKSLIQTVRLFSEEAENVIEKFCE